MRIKEENTNKENTMGYLNKEIIELLRDLLAGERAEGVGVDAGFALGIHADRRRCQGRSLLQ